MLAADRPDPPDLSPEEATALLLNSLLPLEQPPCTLALHTPDSCVAPATWHSQSRTRASAQGSQQLAGHLSAQGCPAELQEGGGPGGCWMGSLSSETSAPLARRSEGRMQELRGGEGAGSRAAPAPQLRQHGSHSPTRPQSVPFMPVLLPPPLSWCLGKDKYLKQSCLLAAVPACQAPLLPPTLGLSLKRCSPTPGSSGPWPGQRRTLLPCCLGKSDTSLRCQEDGWAEALEAKCLQSTGHPPLREGSDR